MSAILEAIDADLIEPQRLAECVLDQIKLERRRPADQRRRLTAREALIVLRFEAHLVCVCAQNIADGITLDCDDLARLQVAWNRIDALISEVIG